MRAVYVRQNGTELEYARTSNFTAAVLKFFVNLADHNKSWDETKKHCKLKRNEKGGGYIFDSSRDIFYVIIDTEAYNILKASIA